MTSESLYYIGIDLGTSNCALSYIKKGDDKVSFLDIHQWSQDGIVSFKTLPSFVSFLSKSEIKRGQFRLPHHGDAALNLLVGHGAKEIALKNPDKVIHSAKSWLTHKGVDRSEKILPWHSDSIIGHKRLSPIEVSSELLKHLKGIWDSNIGLKGPEHRFEKQDIALTVPASFDATAQELTLQAAKLANYPHTIKLLEEPIAAFYGWMSPRAKLKDGLILVCDIGGGTSDFTLIKKHHNSLERIKVSSHILLGGDNIDLALAHYLEPKLSPGKSLSSYSWSQLIAECRRLKESLLRGTEQEYFHISIDSGGSSLFDSTLSCQANANELLDIVKSFFSPCEKKFKVPKVDGLSEWGLPYPKDATISHHLSEFLDGLEIDFILFAGGTMNPALLREAVLDLVESWQGSRPAQLDGDELDLLVAKGASKYLLSESTHENVIASHYPKNLFIQIVDKHQAKALCIIEKGRKKGACKEIKSENLKAIANQRVSFQILESPLDLACNPGDILPLHSSMTAICSVIAKLDLGNNREFSEIPVTLNSLVTETGLLQLECSSEDGKIWPLSFDLSSTVNANIGMNMQVKDADFREITPLIKSLYGKSKSKGIPKVQAKQLAKTVENIWQMPKHDWDLNQLRGLWSQLELGLTRKGRSAEHESAWLNLAGFSLRPGYGHSQDPSYIESAWKLYQMGMSFANDASVQDQWWIFWRRIAGGLNKEQQEIIFDKIAPTLKKDKGASQQSYLLAGSLERVDISKRIQLGNALAQQIASGSKSNLPAKIWCLSRLASRVPLYSGPETIIRPSNIKRWAETLAPLSLQQSHYKKLESFYSLGGRLIQDREFDLDDDLRSHFLEKLIHLGKDHRSVVQVSRYQKLDSHDQNELFGEALPGGLLIS